MAFNYSPKITTDGLIFYLDVANNRSYVSGSTSWYSLTSDISASLSNNITSSIENCGTLQFTTVSSASISHNTICNLSTDFTIDAWYKTLNDSPSIFYSNREEVPGTGFIICRAGGLGKSWKLTKYNIDDIYIGTVPEDTNWHNVVVVYSGSGYVYLYLDGEFQDSSAAASNPIYPTTRYYIGRSEYSNLSGSIGMMKIYNKSLSDNEIRQNYNALKNRFGLR